MTILAAASATNRCMTIGFQKSLFFMLAWTGEAHQIKNGISINKIKETWKDDIIKFKKIREKYLIYN